MLGLRKDEQEKETCSTNTMFTNFGTKRTVSR